MEWFGLTSYGNADPFKRAIKGSYKEPTEPRDLMELYEVEKAALFASDLYIGHDGYAYKSYDRLRRTRQKGAYKPVGPTEMYSRPLTTAMEYGWFTGDPELAGKNWYRSENKFH